MANEYNQKFGGSILMTSGYRSNEEQQRLFEKYGPGRAARPGRSMHNFGYAIDIDNKMTGAGDTLETSGLLKKYGFTRPMAHEPWHIEPIGLKEQYANIQSGGKMVDSGDQQAGDAYSMRNLPRMAIQDAKPSNKSGELNLSDSTIKALAQAIGISFKGALPTSKPNQVSIDMGVRG